MPRQNFLCWLSRASGSRREMASISAMACSATARALTPLALHRRTPLAASCSFEYWSMPAEIDWMNLRLVASGLTSFFHMPEATTTSASPTRFWKSS